MGVLGIDFGTSNTVAALAGDGRSPRLLSLDGPGWMPSCIFVEDDGTLSVGRDAERRARVSPERFEANPKRRIDDVEILLGVRVVPVVDAIAAVLGRVREEAGRQLDGRSPDHVNLTHPAEWGAARRNVLLAAARSAGLGLSISLIPEPVAAAAYFSSQPGRGLPPGACLAVYDLGGGTFDCAVVGSGRAGFIVLAESGLADVGGVDFDQAVIDHLGRTVSVSDPARWQALAAPRKAGDRRAARSLREDVRAAKETLSRYAQTDLPLPEPFDDTLLTRREFEGLIRPVIARTSEVLDSTIARAGVRAAQLTGIYLVGGSSRIPLVARMITDRLGVVPITLDQPETAVAIGATLVPPRSGQLGRTENRGIEGGGVERGGFEGGGFERGPVRAGVVHVPGPPFQEEQFQPGDSPGRNGPGRHLPPGNRGTAQVSGGSRQRRIRLILLAAVVVALIAVGAVVVATRPASVADPVTATTARPFATVPARSTSPAATALARTTPQATRTSSTCSADGNTSGVTPCMALVIGKLGRLTCSQDPSLLSLDATTLGQIQTVTTSWSACVDGVGGFAVVAFQMVSAAGREVMWPYVLKQFTPSRSGTWKIGADAGDYSAGLSSAGLPLVGWKDGKLPVVAFVGGTRAGTTVDQAVEYWRTGSGATITG